MQVHSRMTSNKSISSLESQGSSISIFEDRKRIQKLKEIVNYSKCLNLKVLNKGSSPQGTILKINA